MNFKILLVIGLAAFILITCGKKSTTEAAPADTKSNVSVKGAIQALALTAGLDPAVVEMKVRKVGLSTSEYCTDPVILFSTTTPEYHNFIFAPQIGTGEVENGTYKCIIMEMNDVIKFKPAARSDNGVCVPGTEYVLDVFRDMGEGSTNVSTLIDGTEVTGETNVTTGQWVALYLSTASTNAPTAGGGGSEEGNNWAAPTPNTLSNGFYLNNALVVDGDKIGRFIVDFTGRVSEENQGDGTYSCGCNAPSFGFADAE